MKSRTTCSLVASLLLTVFACAHQEDPGDIPELDDDGKTSGSGGGNGAGSGSKAGSTGKAGATSAGSGGSGTTLPPVGSGGGKGGSKSTGGAGGNVSGGSSGSGGGDDGPIHMPLDGLTLDFVAGETGDEVDYVGGELTFTNEGGEELSLAQIKIRYYFTNEIVAPDFILNWAQFGPINNMGNASCSGELVDMPAPAAGADTYVEITCETDGTGQMGQNTRLKVSWKAGKQGGGAFRLNQADDYSYTPTATGWEKIVVIHGNLLIWGAEP